MSEKAIEAAEVRAALQDLCDAWDHCPSKGHEGGKFKGNITMAQAVAKRVLEKTAALPPLRAREEIARALAKPITGFPFDMLLEEQQAELLKAADAVCALSSTAGQEWRDISAIRSALTPFAVAGASLSAAHNDLHGALAQLTIAHLKEAATAIGLLPAPPVAEPIVAEKSEVKS
jgi:hypothetical protein